jgi:N-acetyl-anhydromuramyl-L-alanine amidase AmpD
VTQAAAATEKETTMAWKGFETAVFAIATTCAVAACSSSGDVATNVDVTATTNGSLSLSFAHAAEHTGVPRDLLVAIARVEDGLELPAQRLVIEEDSAVPAAGPLMLRRGKLDTLARAAFLSGKTEIELRKDSDVALDAGALVLAELGAKSGARADDIASWKTAIEEMSGYADDAHREEYAHRVFAALARGGMLDGRDGERVALAKHDLPPTLTLDVSSKLHTLAVSQFPGAQWIPTTCSNKCTAGRGGAKVEYIVIHDTEGGWDASVATLQNDPGKSVQYIVGTDGKVAQFVTEETTAWHAGNFFFNQRSVGIEHVGYASKPYTEAEYAASAKLVDYLAKKYSVARDRGHIIGHQQIPNGTRIAESAAPCGTAPTSCEANLDFGGSGHHTDPGVWEWPTYMTRIGGAAKCNDVTSIVNCSYDKKKAFRCLAGKVVVDTCDGVGACEVKPNGVDDVCNKSTKPASTPPAGATLGEPGASSSTDDGTGPGTIGEPGAPTTNGAPVSDGELSSDHAAAADAAGCSMTSRHGRGSSPGSFGFALLVAAGVLAFSRRPTARKARES